MPSDLGGVLAVSERALEVGMYVSSKPKFHECDVMLASPELSRYGIFDTRRHREIFEIGRRTALARIDDIREALRAGA